MAFLIGALIGGVMLTGIIAGLVEKVAFRDMEPGKRATFTVAVAWIIVGIIAAFGFSDGGPLSPIPSLYYLPGALIVWAWYRSRYQKAWN